MLDGKERFLTNSNSGSDNTKNRAIKTHYKATVQSIMRLSLYHESSGYHIPDNFQVSIQDTKSMISIF